MLIQILKDGYQDGKGQHSSIRRLNVGLTQLVKELKVAVHQLNKSHHHQSQLRPNHLPAPILHPIAQLLPMLFLHVNKNQELKEKPRKRREEKDGKGDIDFASELA